MKSDQPSNNPILVFDWGDTLMKVLPSFSGPMSTWPQVAQVDGASEVLADLSAAYHLVVATNASDSDASQVWEALKRAGLDSYLKAVFTSRELASRKPELAFYRQIEKVMDRPPYEMVMIGDKFQDDVLGPKQAGWRAVWYNPTHRTAPGLLPLQDGEIANLLKLPIALSQPFAPDYSTTLAWLLERGTPYNILSHIQLVAAAAYQLAVWLAESGVELDPVLVQRGAMLHDLAKMDSILLKKERGEHGDHARMARDFLLQHGQPALSEIADRHMPVSSPTSDRIPRSWEEKLVHFADKMAEGSQLVTLDERIAALQKRYPEFRDELEASQPYLMQVQSEICDRLHLNPQELFARLSQSLGGM